MEPRRRRDAFERTLRAAQRCYGVLLTYFFYDPSAFAACVRSPTRSMKFHLTTGEGNVITGAGPGWIRVGVREYRENVVLTSVEITTGWAAGGFDRLSEADFETLASLGVEIVLLGTGSTLRFPHPRLTRSIAQAGIGLEVMDTAAACRTFNVLSAEGRKVAAALLVA